MNNNVDKEIVQISLDDILPNRFQPRLNFDQNSLNELANSIREHGIIQPLVVRRLGDKYEIIAGERRYKAAIIAGLKTVPAIIMNIDDNESAELAIVENIQRKEMTPLEEAKSYKKLLDKGYLTQEQLAVRMGKSQPAIANKLRLLNLSEEVQDALLREKISERHARSLLSIKSLEDQNKVLNEIINNKLTVKQTDDLIKQRFGVSNEKNNYLPQIKNLQPYAASAILIPDPYTENKPNPQLNLINELNKVEPENKNIQPQLNIESIPINQIPIQEETNINKPIDFDIGKIKEEAKDIAPPIPEPVDINGLLKPEENKSTPEILTEEKKNKFIFDFDEIENNNEEMEILDIGTPVQQPIEEEKTVKSAIDTIKKNITELKNQGFKVTTEEFDYEKTYQIIIKIDK